MSDALAVPQWSISDRLRKARSYAHLEQDDLAVDLGVTRQAVSRWENGAPIKRAFVKVWGETCGVPFEWLWDGIVPEGVSVNRGCLAPWDADWLAQSA